MITLTLNFFWKAQVYIFPYFFDLTNKVAEYTKFLKRKLHTHDSYIQLPIWLQQFRPKCWKGHKLTFSKLSKWYYLQLYTDFQAVHLFVLNSRLESVSQNHANSTYERFLGALYIGVHTHKLTRKSGRLLPFLKNLSQKLTISKIW